MSPTPDDGDFWPGFILVVIVLLVCFALSGCQPQGEPIKPQREMDTFTLRVVMLEPDQVVRTCVGLGAWPAQVAGQAAKHRDLGCAVTRVDAKDCTVYIPRPLYVDDDRTTVLGHEVLHCAIGRYHP